MHDLFTLTISSVQKLNGILEAFVGELICERLLSLSVCPMVVFIHVISDLFIFLQDAEPFVHLYFYVFFSLIVQLQANRNNKGTNVLLDEHMSDCATR